MIQAALERVCLVVSSFRNDEALLRLLSGLLDGKPSPFGEIIVVDSLGTGTVPRAIAERGWRVTYRSYETNLGSAGNLAKRLELAAASGADYAYAVNHDGAVDLAVTARLVSVADQDSSIGAAYPLRRCVAQDGKYDLTGASPIPLRGRYLEAKPAGSTLPVHWGSSNGALYRLSLVRDGLLPWADLWMGWEDLGYGWLLERHGYRQIIVLDAVADEYYEYERHKGVWRVKKPSWYAYYYARNFLIVAWRARQPLRTRMAIMGRLLLEFGVTVLLRDDRRTRITNLTAGIRDGLLCRTGKWRVP